MAGCRLTALLVCLFVSTGGSQGFTVEPAESSLYVRIGEDAEFTVRPSSAISSGNWVFKSKTIVTWIGTTSSILAEYRSRVNLTFITGSLVLRSVNESDNGDYTVSLTTVGGVQASATFTLHALEVIDKPTITANNSHPVEFSDAVTLTCGVSWKANHFEWFQWNNTIRLVERTTLGQDNKTLTISGVLRSDEGFTCLASDGNNSRTSDPYNVDAVYGPDSASITIIPERWMHAVGATVTFTCSVVANHELDFHWYHDNSTVQGDGQQLIIAGLFLNHTGNYTCSASSGTTHKKGLATTSIVVIEPVSQPVITSNDTRPVEHNDTVTLACAAVGTDVSYSWSMNGLALSPGGRLVLSNGNRTLNISGVLRSDKEFTCTGSNPVSTNTSDPFLLDVSYGPESVHISVSPEQAAHTSGTTASLTCSAVSKPAPEYQWFFNVLFQQSGQKLVIAALGVNDTGNYTCQVFNNVTKRSSSTTRNIAVIEPVSKPNITSNASSFIEYNDTVVLACIAAGTNVSYTWLEDNRVIPNDGRLELSASNTTLTITGVFRSDGPLTCRASNAVSAETSEPFHLNVFYGPDLLKIIPDPGTTPYTSGTDVALTCSAESKPAAVLSWYRQGALFQSGAQLTIPNVSNKDIGNYLCQAFNNMTRRYNASSILIDVQERVGNVSLRSNIPELVEHRDSVLLTCSSQGTQLKREWLFKSEPIQQNDRITISRDTLLIAPVNRTDAGMYKCIVSNGLNNGSAETNLTVFYGPDNMKITPLSPVTITNGKDLKLTCSAQSLPSPEYEWFNGAEQLNTSAVFTGPEFIISSVNEQHSGHYTCHVNNSRTGRNDSRTVEVIVQSSGPGAGVIAGIVIAVIVGVGVIGGGTAYLIRKQMTRSKSGTPSSDHKMSPCGNIPMTQTEYAAIGRKQPDPQQLERSNNGTSTAPIQTSDGDVIYISPQIFGPNAKPSGEIGIEDKTTYAALKYR